MKVNYIGEQFSMLTVLSINSYKNRVPEYQCLCACGKTVFVKETCLIDKNITSCGCHLDIDIDAIKGIGKPSPYPNDSTKITIHCEDLSETNLLDTNFYAGHFSFCDFSLSDMRWVSFNDAIIVNCSFDKADMADVGFESAVLSNCSFFGTNLTRASFYNAHLINCRLPLANLTDICWENARVQDMDFFEVCIRQTHSPNK